MKSYVLKFFLLAAGFFAAGFPLQAQFDDVYYDPDLLDPEIRYTYDDPQSQHPEEDVIYYDDDSYAYYDDYDYYYTSRIRRFYNPYIGFGFYDPIYVGYNYYDPYAWDYYAYPGANIYFSFGVGFYSGIGFGWSTPYYYGYNSWYYPSYSYWGGCGGYYPYGNYCNAYYPPGGYYGGSCGGGYYPPYGDHHGGHGDYYYGPRLSGNTGSSPRGPQVPPGIVRSDIKSNGIDVTDSNSKPAGLPEPGTPGKVNPSGNPVNNGPDTNPGKPSSVKQNVTSGVVTHVPADRGITDEVTPSGPKRPVFKPDAERYQPYPTPSRPTPATGQQGTDINTGKPRPSVPQDRPSTSPNSDYRPYPQTQPKEDVRPSGDYRPAGTPSSGIRQEDRPRYTPPSRSVDRSDDKPSYSPPSRTTDEARSNDRPSQSSPQRSESQRSYDPPRQSSPSSGGRSAPSGGGSRSSGGSGGGSGQSSSPRGRG